MPGCSVGGEAMDGVDEVERVRSAGLRPRERREASEAGRPAAYELMIFLRAYRGVSGRAGVG